MKLWDVDSGALIRSFEGHPGRVSAVAFSPDDARVLGRHRYQRCRQSDGLLKRGPAGGEQSVRFDSRGEDFAIGRRLQ